MWLWSSACRQFLAMNDVIVSNNSEVTFKEGYWTFHMISEKLSESGIKLDRNRYNTCKTYSKNNSENLKNLAPFLGFPKDKVIQANTWVESPSTVDVKSPSSADPWTPTKTLTIADVGARSSPRFP